MEKLQDPAFVGLSIDEMVSQIVLKFSDKHIVIASQKARDEGNDDAGFYLSKAYYRARGMMRGKQDHMGNWIGSNRKLDGWEDIHESQLRKLIRKLLVETLEN